MLKDGKEYTPLTVKGLNSRLRRIKAAFGENDAYYTNLMKTLKSTEVGAYITESGFISAKMKDEWLRATAEDNILTVSEILKDVQENEFGGEKATRAELIAQANFREILTGNYDAALAAFYNAKPGDMMTKAFQEFSDIQAQLKHPGRKLSEEEIAQNRTLIEGFVSKVNGGYFNENS